jgi:opacity protein-like surface antigen
MKNLIISLVAIFSLNSYANNMVGINFNEVDGADGFGLSLSGTSGSFVYDVDVMNLEDTLDLIHVGYAFGDVSEGSFYLGFASVSADSRETEAEIGYVRRGSDDVQFKVGLLLGDFEETIDAEVQIPYAGGNLELGLLHDDGDSWVTVGYSWNF